VYNTNVCVPTSAKEVLTVDELLDTDPLAQILHEMCLAGFLWNPCCGPVGNGFTLEALLTALQADFPDHGWIMTDLVNFLTDGIAQGLFKKWPAASSPEEEDLYYANQNLLNVNPKNWIYQDLCPQFCARKSCRAVSSLGGSLLRV
jgi:hypothetical protein